jgi:hypothetical protein
MGYSIPQLRRIRAVSIGTDNTQNVSLELELGAIAQNALPRASKLPKRQRDIVLKYFLDANEFLNAMRSAIVPGGKLITVLGNSNLRGCFVENLALYRNLATRHGFVLNYVGERPLLPSRRYLPITSANMCISEADEV